MVSMNAINRSVSKNQTNMKRINVLASTETRKVLSSVADLSFNEQAGIARRTIPVIAEKYGAVASTVAAAHYNEYRNLHAKELGMPVFTAKPKKFSYDDRIDSLLGFGIASAKTKGFSAMQGVLANGLTYILSDYNRDTIKYNAENDSSTVVTTQRVAEANACAFCSMLAVVEVTQSAIQTDDNSLITYANEYHDNCQCSTEVIFEGSSLIRPSYYDSMEETYSDAYDRLSREGEEEAARQGFSSRNSKFLKENPQYSITGKNIASYMRDGSGMK